MKTKNGVVHRKVRDEEEWESEGWNGGGPSILSTVTHTPEKREKRGHFSQSNKTNEKKRNRTEEKKKEPIMGVMGFFSVLIIGYKKKKKTKGENREKRK